MAPMSKAAFQFLILTAARTSELLNAVWSEIDLKKEVWTIPAERMKAGEEHIVPLPPEAIRVLKIARANSENSELVLAASAKDVSFSNAVFTFSFENRCQAN